MIENKPSSTGQDDVLDDVFVLAVTSGFEFVHVLSIPSRLIAGLYV